MKLLFKMHPEGVDLAGSRVLKRRAARAIVLRGEEILLLYTKAYNDYSLPGGGLEEGESLLLGLQRELQEETGAQDIQVLHEYGYIDEVRSHYKPQYDVMHMMSYIYVCEIGEELGAMQLEPYEVANGMEVQWVNIFAAIDHNRAVLAAKEKSMGLSIARETRVLEMIAQDLVKTA